MAIRARHTAGIATGIVAGVAGITGAVIAAALRRPLPRTGGTLAAPGLAAPVEILRDRWGVPHIYAGSNADLFFAQGYVHAQDRLWQMELQRRTGHGQLAEIFGARALDSDRFLRTLGFGRVAWRETELMKPDERAVVEAYCGGVNAFLAANARHLPLEFTVLRCRPRPWEPVDLAVWGKIMALNLSMNWATEIVRARIVAAVGEARAARLEPTYPGDQPLTVPAGAAYSPALGADGLAAAAATEPFAGARDGTQGSNAWVVGPGRTASGGALLANDPHLALQLPALWYENHLVGGDYAVTGASLPGTPGVIIGHNARIAWGVTNGMNDVQDLYIERFDPTDPTGTRYEFRGAWEEAEVSTETIVVRERPFGTRTRTEMLAVRVTRHGPIISPLLPPDAAPSSPPAPPQTPAPHATEPPLALRWTALEPGGLLRSVLAINRAHDWDEFRAALADWSAPTQNFVYADVDGHIGYALGGRLPVRAQGDGALPVPGWTGEWEWTGTLPPEQNPHALDPAEGFVVSANNRIIGDTYAHPLPGEWLPGYRAARIREMLTRTTRHDAVSFARIHADRLSHSGLLIVALAREGRLPVPDDDETIAMARDTLGAWDGRLTADSVGGLIATTLCDNIVRRAYAEVSGPLGAVVGLGAFAGSPGRSFLHRVLPRVLALVGGDGENWLPDGDTPAAVVRDAWLVTVAALRAAWGDDIALWRHGKAQTLTLRHPLGALRPLRGLLNRGPFPTGGDLNTVCVGARAVSPAGIESYTAASYRQICDPAAWDRSRSSYPGGQSGHPASPHYTDLVGPWLDDRYHPLLWSRAAIEEATVQRLALTPEAR